MLAAFSQQGVGRPSHGTHGHDQRYDRIQKAPVADILTVVIQLKVQAALKGQP